MTRIALLLEYCGAGFCGSQYQPGVRTVQADLEQALSTYARRPVTAIFSGRTDSGVHAKGQVVHVDWPDDDPDLWRLTWSLNGIMKDDVAVSQAMVVQPDFHARFSATRRNYVYRILNRPQKSALLRHTHFFVSQPLDLEKMTESAARLAGDHDFAAFKSSNSDNLTTRCLVSRSELLNLGEGVLEFCISANHFVYNMVRIIVGTLVEIGLGKRQPESIPEALSEGDRSLTGVTAPPWGLCLESVEYPPELVVFSE